MRTNLGDLRVALVAAVLACGLLAGCGGGDEHATDPASPSASVSSATSSPATGSPAGETKVIAVVHAPASGTAEVDPTPVDISTPADLQAFVRTLGAGTWRDQIQRALHGADLPASSRPYAAVIAIGCDVPDAVISGGPGDWQVVAAEVKDPLPECYVANMSVAVVALPD
jgi:hypothetical protein